MLPWSGTTSLQIREPLSAFSEHKLCANSLPLSLHFLFHLILGCGRSYPSDSWRVHESTCNACDYLQLVFIWDKTFSHQYINKCIRLHEYTVTYLYIFKILYTWSSTINMDNCCNDHIQLLCHNYGKTRQSGALPLSAPPSHPVAICFMQVFGNAKGTLVPSWTMWEWCCFFIRRNVFRATLASIFVYFISRDLYKTR